MRKVGNGRKVNRLLVVTAAGLLLSSLGCGAAASDNGAGPPTLTVAAAADLQAAFGEMGTVFASKTGQKVTFTFGSTGNLTRQIENGAPVDVFAAADASYIDGLKAKELVVPGTEKVYGIGRLVLARYKEARVKVDKIEDLLRPEVKKIAIANPEHAPYGRAAKESLISSGIWPQVQAKLVYAENVQQAMQLVQTGNADAGIIALSIAGAPEIEFKPVDASMHSPLNQTMAVIKRSKNEAMAREFVSFVTSAQGRHILTRYGFTLPGES